MIGKIINNKDGWKQNFKGGAKVDGKKAFPKILKILLNKSTKDVFVSNLDH